MAAPHGEQRHAHPLALEVPGSPNAGLAVDGDEAVAEGARGENRNGDERTLLVGEALHELRAGKFGDIELEPACHAVENRPWLIDGDEIEIDALDLDLAGIERLHPVIKSARKRELQPGHRLVIPPSSNAGADLACVLVARHARQHAGRRAFSLEESRKRSASGDSRRSARRRGNAT